MRKVSEAVCKAFKNREYKTIGNTRAAGDYLLLHGNIIATRMNEGIRVTSAGWQTSTTKDRLNSLFRVMGINASISQREYVWYLSDSTGVRVMDGKECYDVK
ncbi:hypothetical protein UFOVP142_4 [uncultured Caudovirales phage]|uniref:Uncharacterized protein n=1 Tax=uncultured Caudovirales phage TaxID=2100421 RepID=A0A6J7XL43_9CAUD|nr:hypothetical protein UFOVP142_4 [uncultured Caudovirales phage]